MGTSSATDVKRAFGRGIGLANEVDMALGDERVTAAMLKQFVSDPMRRASVGAALRGEAVPQAAFEDILKREILMTGTFQNVLDQTMVNGKEIERALRQLEAKNGVVTVNDRFAPEGLTLDQLFRFIYNWNAGRIEEREAPLKLFHDKGEEWWRTDTKVESIPTKAGILTCDFSTVMRATDLAGRPFNLNMDEQVAWAKEQGGDGIRSTEEVVYLFIRSLIENQLPLWGGGSVRCKNTYGSSGSLRVGFYAGNGFYVGCCDRTEQYWALGALPGKSVVLAS